MAYLVTCVGISPTAFAQQLDLSTKQRQLQKKQLRSFEESQEEGQEDDLGVDQPGLPQGLESRMIPYSIHVLGNVKKPGAYRVLPSDKVTDAIKYAGGYLANGSKRSVELRREDTTTMLDIYLYEYQGNLSQNPFLMENDVVYVPTKKGEIQIEGTVNRPGNYEIRKSTTLKSIVEMAGGFTSGRSMKDPIRVVRYDSHEKKEIIEIENTGAAIKDFKVQKGDVIVIPHLLLSEKKFDYAVNRIPGDNIFYPTMDNNVYVVGAVLNPGAYTFQPNYSYKEYVNLAGPTRNIGVKSVKILRRDGSKVRVGKATLIQPGDTLVIPEQRFKPEVMIALVSSVLSVTLSSLVLVDQLRN